MADEAYVITDPPSSTLEESDQISERTDRAMRLLAMFSRVVGWAWMLMLVIATLSVDEGADPAIVVGSMALATVWTATTVWAARSRSVLGSRWFAVTDLVVVLLVGGASWAAGAENLFHGGYLIPSLIVAAYALNMSGVAVVATLIGLQQAAILFSWGEGPVPALSSLGFIVWGLIFSWLFGTIRRTDAYRRATVEELMAERETSVRRGERLELANRLHDSALQTLQVIVTEAEDVERVRRLAKRQSRELHNLVDSYSSGSPETLKAALLDAAGETEELFSVEVSAVVRADLRMDAIHSVLVGAAREAMTNAAKYSEAGQIHLYAALEDGWTAIYVRDDGVGFDLDTTEEGHGLKHSIRGRVLEIGGDVCIESAPGEGTEIKVSAPVGGASS